MERPDFIDERASSGEVRAILRGLDDKIAYEMSIAAEMPSLHKTQDMRIAAIKSMRIKAAAWFQIKRRREEEELEMSS